MKRYLEMIVAFLLLFVVAGVRAQESQNSDGAVRQKRDNAANKLYVVQMSKAPAVDYRGDLPGLRATKPAAGQKFTRANPDVDAYAAHLDGDHDQAVRAAGGRKVYDYHY